MASKPKRPCNRVGCRNLTDRTYCAEHEQQYKQEKERYRQSAHERGYDSSWRKASKQFLSEHPLCVHCEAEGSIRSATVTDHIIPHKGDPVLFWDKKNWQSLCKRHHDIKTAKEDGGFGR